MSVQRCKYGIAGVGKDSVNQGSYRDISSPLLAGGTNIVGGTPPILAADHGN